MNDQFYRGRTRNAQDPAKAEKARAKQIRSWIILVSAVVLILLGIHFFRSAGTAREIAASKLPCYASQNVTPFGDNVIYYDGATIHCLTSTGTIRWSYRVGEGVTFSVGPKHIVAWAGRQLYIVDKDGNPCYNEAMDGPVQFARIGNRYCAAVIGEDMKPTLMVKDLNGAQVDVEADAFNNLLIMDVGFYGDQGQYLWTLAMDVYGTAANTILNTFQVGKMNTGEVSLGEFLTYKVLFEDSKLRVFTTQQMYTYDYKCVQDTNSTMLVYGWKVIDDEIPERGSATILMAPTSQTSSAQTITELRALRGGTDLRYTLPSSCVGAALQNGNIYAFSKDYLYRADVNGQKFYGYTLPLPENTNVTAFYGITSDGRALLAAGETVYSVSLPE